MGLDRERDVVRSDLSESMFDVIERLEPTPERRNTFGTNGVDFLNGELVGLIDSSTAGGGWYKQLTDQNSVLDI